MGFRITQRMAPGVYLSRPVGFMYGMEKACQEANVKAAVARKVRKARKRLAKRGVL